MRGIDALARPAGEGGGLPAGLWRLLERQTALYTMGEHSSVPLETARELLCSIRFSVGLYLDTLPPEQAARALEEGAWEALLRLGREEAERQVERGRDLLRRARLEPFPRASRSFRDTLEELELFFRRYDPRYFAHQVPCMIDYQLSQGLGEADWQGISYINEYLRRLNLENDFCARFDRGAGYALLGAACLEYRTLLVNLYEPLAVNALGLTLLGEDVFGLNIGANGRAALGARFHRWTGEACAAALDGGGVRGGAGRRRADALPGPGPARGGGLPARHRRRPGRPRAGLPAHGGPVGHFCGDFVAKRAGARSNGCNERRGRPWKSSSRRRRSRPRRWICPGCWTSTGTACCACARST